MTRDQAEQWAQRFNERVPDGKDLAYEAVEGRGGHWKVRARRPVRELRPRFYRTRRVAEPLLGGIIFIGFWGALIGGCGYLLTSVDTGTETRAGGRCHASYKWQCLKPSAYDYDCAGGSGDGPRYAGAVRVVGSDDFGLDRDGDGYACE